MYALEGSVFSAGSILEWLKKEMQIIDDVKHSENIASSLQNNGGVYFIPAFNGLGAPHWDMNAKATITGLTRGANKKHIIRAALESIAYQTKDVLDAMNIDSGINLKQLKADGGASSNNWLMQFQSDILQTNVIRPTYVESTALGAAMLAGSGVGLFTLTQLKEINFPSIINSPKMDIELSKKLISEWKKAVGKLVMGDW